MTGGAPSPRSDVLGQGKPPGGAEAKFGLIAGSRWRRILSWGFGLAALGAVILVALQFASIDRFVQLARSAKPEWMLLALIAQAATYACAAAVWRRLLLRAGSPRRLIDLIPLAVAKLFTDQALPSSGISGTFLVMSGLARRQVPANLAMAALLVGLVSYEAAYILAVLCTVGLLWLHHRGSFGFSLGVTGVALLAAAVPASVLGLRRWVGNKKAAGLWAALARRLPGTSALLQVIAAAPTSYLRDPRLVAETVILQFAIVVLDASTLWCAFAALGAPQPPWIVFVGSVMANVTETVAPIPLGIGSFEAGAVGMLSSLGVPVEAALAATLVLRGLTFWLPMLPGLWLARREARA